MACSTAPLLFYFTTLLLHYSSTLLYYYSTPMERHAMHHLSIRGMHMQREWQAGCVRYFVYLQRSFVHFDGPHELVTGVFGDLQQSNKTISKWL